MVTASLEKAIMYAKEHKISRVTEIKCPRTTCGKTFSVFAGDERGRTAWLEEFKNNRFKRHIYCKHCGYGAMGDAEGQFEFKNHAVVVVQ
jgi:hypothetical protein